jgi:hypothetical protein
VKLLGRIRRSKKGPLAVASILATPLFFAALMAFSLKLDEPTLEATGALGDPSKSTVLSIYLSAFGVCAVVVLAGVLGIFVRAPVGVFVCSLTAIAAAILLRLPLGTWEQQHTARYPQGVDLIPKTDPGDLFLRGEWEENAHRTADQLAFWTIAMAITAIVIATALDVRRRRHLEGRPPVPPPPDVAGNVPT